MMIGEDPRSEQGDAGQGMPDVHGQVWERDRQHRPGDSGGTPEGYHRSPDRGGGCTVNNTVNNESHQLQYKQHYDIQKLRPCRVSSLSGYPYYRPSPCLMLWCVDCVLLQEIYQDRKKFSEQVFKVASSDLVNMGIGVVSYTLKDVHDDQVQPGWDSGCQEEELLSFILLFQEL